jgi:1,4-dihydroxy-6-naphthoate synthase
MTKKPLSLGFSPCPNDTFIFYALVHGLIDSREEVAANPKLEDVETLNEWALQEELDITKLSFHAYGHVRDRYVLLDSGSALGRGCGPLLISNRKGLTARDLPGLRVAVPGRLTTAAMLLRLFGPEVEPVVMRFDTIIAALLAGRVDAGVIIHESRFTYQQHDLHLMQDLGAWWEETSGCPIPLGGIAVRRDLGEKRSEAISDAVRRSVEWAFANRQQCLPYIRSHAQELDEAIIASHIDLYVNQYSVSLGSEGRTAVRRFLERGVEAGIFPG